MELYTASIRTVSIKSRFCYNVWEGETFLLPFFDASGLPPVIFFRWSFKMEKKTNQKSTKADFLSFFFHRFEKMWPSLLEQKNNQKKTKHLNNKISRNICEHILKEGQESSKRIRSTPAFRSLANADFRGIKCAAQAKKTPGVLYEFVTFPKTKTNRPPENSLSLLKMKCRLPTINVQAQAVSFREGNPNTIEYNPIMGIFTRSNGTGYLFFL